MSDPERDLSLLLSAVSDLRGPPPELFVRYVDDPGSLTDAERAEVERAVAESPLLAGELRALQSFRFPAPLGAPLKPPRAPRAANLRSALWVGGPLAAAVAAVFLVLCRPEPAPRSSALGEPRPSVQAALRTPATEPPAASPGAGSPPAPTTVATAETPRPAQPPARQVTPVLREPAPPDEVPAPSAPAEMVLLAFLEPQYRPPPDAQARYRIGGGTRAAGAQGTLVELEVLAPAHIALTRSPTPSLFWRLEPLPVDAAVFQLTVSAAMTPEPLLEVALPPPQRGGLQRVRLASYGVELEPGVEYIWTISADVAGSRSAAQGWIQRTDSAPAIVAASPGELSAEYAAAGLWYDAVEALADLAERHPGDDRIAQALVSLAAQARIEAN